MTKPVSVIIPAYNAEKTIEECIESVLNQKYKPSEVIVVDDGSTDNTAEIASKFEDVKVIKTGCNQGAGYARNLGIEKSKYEYIFFTDSDSFPLKDCIEILMNEFLKDEKIGIVGGSNPSSEYIEERYNKLYEITNRYGHSRNSKEGYVEYVPTANFCIKREVFKRIGLFDIRLLSHQDFDLCIRARRNGYKIYFQPKAIANHFHQRTSLKKYLRYAYKGGIYGTIFRLKHKPYAPFSNYLPQNFILTALMVPFMFLFSTGRVVQKNIHLRPFSEILFNIHLISLNQLSMCLGMVKGTYLFGRMK